MSKQDLKIVDLKTQRAADMEQTAQNLREIADRCEKGHITEIVIVLRDNEDNCFERYATFEDRWRLFGALEYAKTTIID